VVNANAYATRPLGACILIAMVRFSAARSQL
jgi:hypothetical protein